MISHCEGCQRSVSADFSRGQQPADHTIHEALSTSKDTGSCLQSKANTCACSAGHILYHGPRSDCLAFFKSLGFDIPERKGIPDFLQEVSGRTDQEVPADVHLIVNSWRNLNSHFKCHSA